MVTLTVRPTSASGTYWQYTKRVYDGQTNQAAKVNISASDYSSKTLTIGFSGINIPENAHINSATLYVITKQSTSYSTDRITVQVDVNGNSSSRVINQQLETADSTTLNGDVSSYINNLTSIKITGQTAASSSQSQTFSIYEVYVDIVYEIVEPEPEPDIPGENISETTVDIFLPQPLGTNDKLYWDDVANRYYIQHSTGLIQTDITNKIEFDTCDSHMKIVTDEKEVAPTNITVELAMKEGSNTPNEDGWIIINAQKGFLPNVEQLEDGYAANECYTTDIFSVNAKDNLTFKIVANDISFDSCGIYTIQVYDNNKSALATLWGGPFSYDGSFNFTLTDYFNDFDPDIIKYCAFTFLFVADNNSAIISDDVTVMLKVGEENLPEFDISGWAIISTTNGYWNSTTGELTYDYYYSVMTDYMFINGKDPVYVRIQSTKELEDGFLFGIEAVGYYWSDKEYIKTEEIYAEVPNGNVYAVDTIGSTYMKLRIALLDSNCNYEQQPIYPDDVIVTFSLTEPETPDNPSEDGWITLDVTQGCDLGLDGTGLTNNDLYTSELFPYEYGNELHFNITASNITYKTCGILTLNFFVDHNDNSISLVSTEWMYATGENEFIFNNENLAYDYSTTGVNCCSITFCFFDEEENIVRPNPEDIRVMFKSNKGSISGPDTPDKDGWSIINTHQGYYNGGDYNSDNYTGLSTLIATDLIDVNINDCDGIFIDIETKNGVSKTEYRCYHTDYFYADKAYIGYKDINYSFSNNNPVYIPVEDFERFQYGIVTIGHRSDGVVTRPDDMTVTYKKVKWAIADLQQGYWDEENEILDPDAKSVISEIIDVSSTDQGVYFDIDVFTDESKQFFGIIYIDYFNHDGSHAGCYDTQYNSNGGQFGYGPIFFPTSTWEDCPYISVTIVHYTSTISPEDITLKYELAGSNTSEPEKTNSLRIGDTVINNIYMGDSQVLKICLGDILIYGHGVIEDDGDPEPGEKPESTYTVETATGAIYGFTLNSDGYWESTNKGIHSSAAVCKVTIKNPRQCKMYIDYINYGEGSYDHGIISNINTTLSTNNIKDSSNVKLSIGLSTPSVQTLSYGVMPEECFIYIKYRKDSSDNANNDSLQFKIRFEEYIPSEEFGYRVETVDGASYGFELNNDGYWESTNKGINSSAAVCKVTIMNPNDEKSVYIDCINYAEKGYDYGLLSNINTPLSTDNSEIDSSVKTNFSSSSSSSIRTVSYGQVEDQSVIYVKYKKDSSGHENNDSLQFKVRLE